MLLENLGNLFFGGFVGTQLPRIIGDWLHKQATLFSFLLECSYIYELTRPHWLEILISMDAGVVTNIGIGEIL